MPKRKIDVEEYEVKKYEKSQLQVLKEMLEGIAGKRVLISSNRERFKGDSKREIVIYNVGQQYNELGQVLTLENPSLPEKAIPILVSPNLKILKEDKKITLRYEKELPFKGLRKQFLPDLEIYIEELSK